MSRFVNAFVTGHIVWCVSMSMSIAIFIFISMPMSTFISAAHCWDLGESCVDDDRVLFWSADN